MPKSIKLPLRGSVLSFFPSHKQIKNFRFTKVLLVVITLLSCQFLFGQAVQVRGKVTSGDTALSNITVQVKGSTRATQTDNEGNFTISASPNATLVFSAVGFTRQEVAVNNQTTLNVRLENSSTQLEQVVVVGYGTQRRQDITGSISSVSAAQIAKVPVNTIDQAIQGRAAGVQVINNDGRPGGGVTVQIRGVGSLGANGNEPLYVVDGYPIGGGINNINPNDIATIDILKDASAASIYGMRAANGVVLITTKRGKKDGLQVSLDLTTSSQSKPKKYDVLNAQEFAAMVKEVTTDPSQGSFTPLPEWSTPSSLTTVDWQDALYRSGLKQNYNIAVRGGNDKVQTSFSLGYNDHKGVVQGSYFKRYNLGLNMDYNVTKWLKSQTSVKYARQDQNTPFGTGGLQQLTELIPTITGNKLTNQIKDASGNYGFYNPVNIYTKSWGNPLFEIESREFVNLNNNLLANTSLDVTILSGLRFKTNVGVNVSDFSGSYFQPEDLRWQQQYGLSGANQISGYNQNTNNNFEWLWENTLSYTKSFGQHNIDIVAGVSAQKNTNRYLNSGGTGLINNALRDINQLQNLTTRNGSRSVSTLASQFGRINYKYADKYYVTGTVRRDGVSKFAPGYEYGVFPSVSAAWRIKGEEFLKNAGWLNDLKLRIGWGEMGNQASIPAFQWQNLFSTGGPGSSGSNFGYSFNDIYQAGLAPTQPLNPSLRWETDVTKNIGLDVALLKGALTITADYYDRTSKDFLLVLPVSSQTGYNSLAQNVGKIQNKGLELGINYNKSKGDFTYGVGLTFSTVNNKLLSINKALSFIDNLVTVTGLNANSWNQFSRTNIGQGIGEFFGYRSLGIFQTQAQIDALNASSLSKNPAFPFYQKNVTRPGDRYFADVNGDGHVDVSDRTNLGSPLPKFYGGLNLDGAYKRFDFNIYFYGVSGNKIFNYQARMLESFQAPGFVGVQNVGSDYFKNHWTPTNPSNRYTRFTYNDDVISSNVPSSQYVEDGSYLRLKNLQIGYSIPAHSFGSMSIPKIRVYVSGQNLFTITKYSGLDPEIGVANGSATAAGVDPGSYPLSRFYTLGLNVTF